MASWYNKQQPKSKIVDYNTKNTFYAFNYNCSELLTVHQIARELVGSISRIFVPITVYCITHLVHIFLSLCLLWLLLVLFILISSRGTRILCLTTTRLVSDTILIFRLFLQFQTVDTWYSLWMRGVRECQTHAEHALLPFDKNTILVRFLKLMYACAHQRMYVESR